MNEKIQKVLGRLQALCARGEYCTCDIRRKAMKALDDDDAAVEEVMTGLLSDGFVDDRRYAAAFAREKASLSGWGPVKISYALRGKGIDEGCIKEALEEIDGAVAEEKLSKLISSKAASLQGDPQIRLKLIKFALSRGYAYDVVRPLVEEY